MEKQAINKTTIRFRRWSRKGYSIFYSLKKQVTIGVLDIKIATLSMKKQSKKILISILNLLSLDSESISEKEREDKLENELMLQTINIVNSNLKDNSGNSFILNDILGSYRFVEKLMRAFLFMVQDIKTVGVGLVPTFRTVYFLKNKNNELY